MVNERPSEELIASTRREVTLVGGPKDGEKITLELGTAGWNYPEIDATGRWVMHLYWLDADRQTMTYDGTEPW